MWRRVTCILPRARAQVILLGNGAVGKTSVATRFTKDLFAKQYKQTIGLDFFLRRIVLPGPCAPRPPLCLTTLVGSLRPTPLLLTPAMPCACLAGDIHVALQIWDIGGQSIGSKMIKNYIFGAQVKRRTRTVLFLRRLTRNPTTHAGRRTHVRHYELRQFRGSGGLVPACPSHIRQPRHAVCGTSWQQKYAGCAPACPSVPTRTLLTVVCKRVGTCAADLLHMKAVKTSKHNQFAEENDFYSYVMSAKTGDQVNACFTRIAADLAGVVLSRAELDVQTKPVTAELINHQQNDPTVVEPDAPASGKKRCAVQ